ncbi:RNA polymerase sigma factor SigJ [Nocardioides marmorisolisilvae]|uniref:Sigma-70 family RNA polymerase sigma factor n=1 Tax=Nocardioides marmorisolisilvae TaxID=1542737 RepID=A0A3N0DI61_9ACTN|nr:RNA polymerase sigma factor SigJ [Nocardioides marmorisolisilvae]RNL75368.1 sigma-70 family RNA polymerase sigma factor [Nocardioides marmorisolisilvae]
MTDEQAALLFEGHRAYLTAVAYRLLGTVADAEDAVQETYLRFARADLAKIHEPRGWLTTAISRICLDHLGSARVRREQYVGQWLPEPVVGTGIGMDWLGPEDRVTLDDSVSMAMLVVLESLSPAERTAFVLHDVLSLSYDDVATTVGRSEQACRQLVSRARVHIKERAPRFTVDADQQSEVVQAFLAACTDGSVDTLVDVLAPEVVLRSDGGGVVSGVAMRPVIGARNVARLLLGVAAKHEAFPWTSRVNGAPGLVFESQDGVAGVMAFTVDAGRITEIHFVVNPEKLSRVPRADH